MDCETLRFTIEQPFSEENFYQWCQEADHAVIAGRHIGCVPLGDSSIKEIQGLGTGLGYVYWPSMTILAPPVAKLPDGSAEGAAATNANRQEENELRLRLLARVGII